MIYTTQSWTGRVLCAERSSLTPKQWKKLWMGSSTCTERNPHKFHNWSITNHPTNRWSKPNSRRDLDFNFDFGFGLAFMGMGKERRRARSGRRRAKLKMVGKGREIWICRTCNGDSWALLKLADGFELFALWTSSLT